MSFTVQVGPVLAARLNSMSCSYWSSQASSRKGLSCMRAPRKRTLVPAIDYASGRTDDFLVMDDRTPGLDSVPQTYLGGDDNAIRWKVRARFRRQFCRESARVRDPPQRRPNSCSRWVK